MKRGGTISAMLLIAIAIAVALTIPLQTAQGAGVGVWNTPPTFMSLEVIDLDNEMALILNVSDYNGWEDIFRVTVTVTDPSGVAVEEVRYQQYPTNTSSVRTDTFEESKGRFLKPANLDDPWSGSRVQRFSGIDWFIDNTTQQIVFLFEPFAGANLHIEAEDKAGLMSIHEGPFSGKYQTPPLLTNDVIPLGISLLAAAAGGTAVAIDRRGSNKAARAAEAMRKKGGI